MNVIQIKLAESPRPSLPTSTNRSDRAFFYKIKNDGKVISFFTYLIDLYNRSAKHGGIIRNKVKYIYGQGTKEKRINEAIKKAIASLEVFNGFYLKVQKNSSGVITNIECLPFERMVRSEDGKKLFYNPNPNRLNESDLIPMGEDVIMFHNTDIGYDLYPLPNYAQAIDYIATDVLVAKHTFTNAKKGFRPTKHITLTNGEPTDEVKRQIKNQFSNTYEGEDGESIILDFVSHPSRAAIINDLGLSLLSKEDYSSVNELIQSNIFTAHGVTSPALFGISTPGSLGDKNNIIQAYDIFNNTYAVHQRQIVEDQFSKILGYDVIIEALPPLQIDLPEALIIQHAPSSWVLEKLGIDTQKFSSHITDEYALQVFAEHGISASNYYEFAKVGAADLKEIASVIKDNNSIQITDIAQTLKLDVEYVNDAISELKSKGKLSGKDGSWSIDSDVVEYKVMFSYEWRDEVPLEKRTTDTMRQFCKKLMGLNRIYSNADIEKISLRLGYDVFSRAGGWWNDGGIVKPHCRHYWKAKLYNVK